jgi:hypothetical protein
MLVLYQLQIITGYDSQVNEPSCSLTLLFSNKPFPELCTGLGLPYDWQLCVVEDPGRPSDVCVLF